MGRWSLVTSGSGGNKVNVLKNADGDAVYVDVIMVTDVAIGTRPPPWSGTLAGD